MGPDQSDAPPPDAIFDEEWYLSGYPGVAQVVRAGGFRSGWEHYIAHGREEGRLPAPLTRLAQSIVEQPARPPTGSAETPFWRHNGAGFSAPEELAVSGSGPRRIAVIGPAPPERGWLSQILSHRCAVDAIVADPVARPPERVADAGDSHDVVVVEIATREILDDDALNRVPHWDIAGHARIFHAACRRLEAHLRSRMQWNREHHVMTFVANFLSPQQNPMGRLFPRHDIRNPEYFVAELNRYLENAVRQFRNAFVLDVDRLAASIGRRFIQADPVFPFGDGKLLASESDSVDWVGRSISEHYDMGTRNLFPDAVWGEVLAMYRSAREADPVRLVIVEPADILWRTRGAPGTEDAEPSTSGWPAGIADALVQLGKRGIRLAIVSQNDEHLVRLIWPDIFGDRLRPEDFAAIRINWRPKPENVRQLLDEFDLPSRSAVFVDPDPAEREAMRLAFPDIRLLGDFPFYLRRTLLWSAEAQMTPAFESWAHRIEIIRCPGAREPAEATMARSPASTLPCDATGTVLSRARERLDQLWSRAMSNAISAEEADELRRLGMAIAVVDRGIRRVRPFADWATQ